MSWTRVSNKEPCPICGKPDWCTIGNYAACCMRVQSAKPADNGGWLHKLGGPADRPVTPRPTPELRTLSLDFEDLFTRWRRDTSQTRIEQIANRLGVDAWALNKVGVAWTGRSWAFPMYDPNLRLVGIRIRTDRGDKYAIKGSRNGLFVPSDEAGECLWIVEGPTDAAAGVQLGLSVIGRPSCSGARSWILEMVRRMAPKRVVLVADNDDPGIQGAQRLQAELEVSSLLLALPCKDLRVFVHNGGTLEDIHNLIKDRVWTRVTSVN